MATANKHPPVVDAAWVASYLCQCAQICEQDCCSVSVLCICPLGRCWPNGVDYSATSAHPQLYGEGKMTYYTHGDEEKHKGPTTHRDQGPPPLPKPEVSAS
jgi:hypothetical protein